MSADGLVETSAILHRRISGQTIHGTPALGNSVYSDGGRLSFAAEYLGDQGLVEKYVVARIFACEIDEEGLTD